MKRILLFTIILFLLVLPLLLWKATYFEAAEQHIYNKNEKSHQSQHADVSDDIKTAIITKVLSETDRKDHAISDDGKLYLYLSESIFKSLPKSVNGIEIKLIESPEIAKKSKLDYQTFTRWDQQDELIWVTNTAFFYDGNSGGCNFKFEKNNDEWVKKSTDCFAMAH